MVLDYDKDIAMTDTGTRAELLTGDIVKDVESGHVGRIVKLGHSVTLVHWLFLDIVTGSAYVATQNLRFIVRHEVNQ